MRSKRIPLIVSILLLTGICLKGLRARQEDETPGAKSFQIRVDMVSLPVVVTTGKGEYVTNLKKEDFRVFDNGIPQEISGFANVKEPVSVALVLDSSDSMRKQASIIQNEAIRFVGFLKKEDRLAILSFNDDVVLWEPFSLYGKKSPMTIRKIDFRGMSAVYEAVWLSIEQVLKHEFGRKALVLFSDGIDNRSRTVTEEETLDLARKTEATIYSVYYHAEEKSFRRFPLPGGGSEKKAEYEAGREYLMKLSGFSGGALFDAEKIGDLSAAFRKIARELSSQYSLGYYPSNLENMGEYHRVEVQLKKSGYRARTKEGYYAPKK